MNVVSSKDFYRRIGRLDPKVSANVSKLMNSKLKTTTFVEPNKSLDIYFGPSTSLSKNSSILSSTPSLDSITSSEAYDSFASSVVHKKNFRSELNIYTAFTEGRGYAEGEIGLATIDIDCPTLYLTQFSDNFIHSGFVMKLNINTPSQILVPKTIYNSSSKALDAVRKNFSEIKIVPMPRRHFNADEGLEMIKSYSTEDCKTSIEFYENRYYALTAASALLKYLKSIQMINFLPNSLKIEYQNRNLRMHIDQESCHRLELLYPLADTKEKKTSLFGLLDNTITSIGKRYLRARILEPYFDKNEIDSTQKCIKELLENSDIFHSLREKLKIFCNIDKILKVSIATSESDCFKAVETMLNDILILKHYLENITELAEILKPCKCFLIQKLHLNLTDQRLKSTLEAINGIIRPEVKLLKGSLQCFQRIHAIRPDLNPLLDMIRDEYNKLTDEVHKIINNFATEHKISFRMIYSNSKKFHIQLQLPKNDVQDFDIPAGLKLLYKKGNLIYFTTPEINRINFRITEVTKEAYIICSKIVRQLLENLMKFIDGNYLLIETIAHLDIIQSFTMVSQCDRYCCPTFDDEMRVVDAIHPLLEHSNTKPVAVPNNIIATPEYNFFVITGPNMGGKTVYIKTIAILQIMAQLGCFVPAKTAKFRICDKIFTRIGFEDNIENNRSSFANEIKEMEYIFTNLTTNSLVIIDELCRSTNPIEGVELSWKICEKLCSMRGKPSADNLNECSLKLAEGQIPKFKKMPLKNVKNEKGFQLSKLTVPFTFITTHFMKLTKLKDFHFNIINLHLAAEEKNDNGNLSIKYTHKVLEGVTPIVGYGLSLARIHRFPEKILTRAQEIFDEIMFQEKSKKEKTLNKSFYTNSFIKVLEKSFNSQFNQNFEREPQILAKNISKFMNSSNHNNSTSSTLETVTGLQLINDFKYQLYDLYAEIAAIIRQTQSKSDYESQITNLLQSFKNSLPNEILEKLIPEEKLENLKITTNLITNSEEFLPPNQCVLEEDCHRIKIIENNQIKPPNVIKETDKAVFKNFNIINSMIGETQPKPDKFRNESEKERDTVQLSQPVGKTALRNLLQHWKMEDFTKFLKIGQDLRSIEQEEKPGPSKGKMDRTF